MRKSPERFCTRRTIFHQAELNFGVCVAARLALQFASRIWRCTRNQIEKEPRRRRDAEKTEADNNFAAPPHEHTHIVCLMSSRYAALCVYALCCDIERRVGRAGGISCQCKTKLTQRESRSATTAFCSPRSSRRQQDFPCIQQICVLCPRRWRLESGCWVRASHKDADQYRDYCF